MRRLAGLLTCLLPLRPGFGLAHATGGWLMVKRLSWAGPGKVRIASDNERFYPAIEIDSGDDVGILGEVVWYCRELRK